MAAQAPAAVTELAQPMLGLGGLRINPRTNGPHRNAARAGVTFKTIATGAARSGAYNRTSTPFGFQADTRTFREAPQIDEKLAAF